MTVACDRVAHRLYDSPTTHDDLVNMATILLLLCGKLREPVREYALAHGSTRRALAAGMALEAVSRRLTQIRTDDAVSDDSLRRVLDIALHLLVRIMSILNTPSGRASATLPA